jgi:2-dehydro-3-deoxyglucarate aldolase/4-hydroxy-2-oxoheptanedioate aldolase
LSLRARLRKCERLIGTIVSMPSPEIAELLVLSGFDWLFVDMEHGLIGQHG